MYPVFTLNKVYVLQKQSNVFKQAREVVSRENAIAPAKSEVKFDTCKHSLWSQYPDDLFSLENEKLRRRHDGCF